MSLIFKTDKPFPDYFFESQQGSGCGRHAINNLFQEVVYDITDPREINLDAPEFPMNMKKLCVKLAARYKELHPDPRAGNPIDCQPNENYQDIMVDAALKLKRYENIYNFFNLNKDDLDSQDLDDKFILVHLPGHWTCARKLNDKFYYIDSMNGYIQFDDQDKLKEYLKNLLISDEHILTIYQKSDNYIKPIEGGFKKDNYKEKYLKYKSKYLNLKRSLQ